MASAFVPSLPGGADGLLPRDVAEKIAYKNAERLFGRKLYSLALVEVHFWTATIGIVLYITSMWVAGIMQGLMWRATNADGTLTYSFVESVQAMHPYYIVRFLGGAVFLFGSIVMAWNLWKTIKGAQPAVGAIPEPATAH